MIDLHCHLDLFDDPGAVAAEAEEARIYVLSVTTTPKAWKGTSALAKDRKFIRTGLGLHPQLAHERAHELPLFEALLDQTRYVGEIGLDGSRDYRQHAEIQLKVFERVLNSSRAAGRKLFTVHSRGAAAEVIAALKRARCAETAVLHWFSGSKAELKQAIGAGCWFSVGPAMLQSAKGRALAEDIPHDRLLTETDGPFAKLKSRPLKPVDVWLAVDQLVELWHVDRPTVMERLQVNLRALLASVPTNEPNSV